LVSLFDQTVTNIDLSRSNYDFATVRPRTLGGIEYDNTISWGITQVLCSGIGARSNYIEYDIEGRFESLNVVLANSVNSSPNMLMEFQIFLDDEEVWSDELARAKPQEVSIDVRSTSVLRIAWTKLKCGDGFGVVAAPILTLPADGV